MSGPSVWNGRNERILGPSTDSSASISTLPTSNVDRPPTAKSSSDAGGKNSVNNNGVKSSATPAPVPTKSVWNGKHDKIKEMAAPPSAAVASPTPGESAAVPPSKTKNSMTCIKKKKATSSSTSNPKNNNKVVLPSTLSKEASVHIDEGTNSTAGSSTTNTIEEETLEGNNRGNINVNVTSAEDRQNVVVNVVQSPASSNTCSSGAVEMEEEMKTESVEKSEPSSESGAAVEEKREAVSEAPPEVSVGEKKKKKETASAAGAGSQQVGGKSNQKKGGRPNNNNNNSFNSSQNNGHRGGNNKQHGNNHSSRGSGSGGRRKANNAASTQNADKPVCAFFVRGMCNRGTACAFKHDPAFAPAPSSGAYPNNQLQRHGSNGSSPNQHHNGSSPPSSMPFNRLGSGRVFDPLKARAIQMAKDAQDKEDRSIFASPSSYMHQELAKMPTNGNIIEPPFFSIDVECIATGYGSCAKGINDGVGNEGKNGQDVPSSQYNELSHRYPGRVAMVDSDGNLLLDIIIRPPQNGRGVVSYLTPLTGLTEEMCLGPHAKTLESAVNLVKSMLPKNGVLVGQAIDHDVEWLGLTPGRDFGRMVDLSIIFRQRMPAILGLASAALKNASESGCVLGNKDADPSTDSYLGFDTRYRSFSLRHVCLNLLGTDIQSGVHDPIVDARYSLILFHKYRNSSVTQLRIVRDGLHRAPVTPGFAAEKTPVLDGVCVSAAGYPYKRAARKIWRWYSGKREQQQSKNQSS